MLATKGAGDYRVCPSSTFAAVIVTPTAETYKSRRSSSFQTSRPPHTTRPLTIGLRSTTFH